MKKMNNSLHYGGSELSAVNVPCSLTTLHFLGDLDLCIICSYPNNKRVQMIQTIMPVESPQRLKFVYAIFQN